MEPTPDLVRLIGGAERLEALAESPWNALVVVGPDGAIRHASRASARILGYQPEELVGLDVFQLIHPDDQPATRAAFADLLRTPGGTVNARYRARRRDGSWLWTEGTGVNLLDDPQVRALVCHYRDITEERWTAALLEGRNSLLERIARGAPLSETLTALVRFMEEQSGSARCSVLLLDADGRRLRHGAAPGMPESYNQAVDGLEIGPAVGSCGSAAYLKQPVVVTDVERDPRWASARELAREHGIRGCWSTPILNAAGDVLGTFALYYREAVEPPAHDHRLVENATHLARLAIERARSEEALRESEGRYRRIVETANEGVWMLDADRRTSYVNPRMAQILGYAPQEMLGRHIHDFVFEADRAALDRRRPDRLAGREAQYDFRFRRQDGSEAWLLCCTRPIHDEEGRFAGVLGMFTDITERYRALEGLRHIASSARCLLWQAEIVDRGEGRSLGWDIRVFDEEAARRLLPIPVRAGESYSAAWYASRPREDQRQTDALAETSIRAGRGYSHEFRCRLESGELRWLSEEVHVETLAPGRWRAVGVAMDVTERREAEEELRATSEQYATTFDCAPIGITHLTPEGRWTRVNQRFCDIVGYSCEELIGRDFRSITHPDDLEADVAIRSWLLDGELSSFQREKRYAHKSGKTVWVNLTLTLLRDPAGEPRYFISIVEDITDRRHLAEQLRQAQRLEAVGRLAGGVAHDFNNMLAVINGYSELLLGGLQPGDALQAPLEEIHKAGVRAAGLTRQLLAFSRKQMVSPQVLDLNAIVASADNLLRRLIGEDVEPVTVLAPDLGRVRADRGQVEQIIMNLALNARDAMPRGGRLTLETGNVELDETYQGRHMRARSGSYVMLAVSDTGCGIDSETLPFIFDPFFTTKEPGKGTGLGLATVYGIVQQNGGDIWVYSETAAPGRRSGTTFKIYLPRVDAAVPVVDEPGGQGPRGTETVLLVEDEAMVRSLVSVVLRGHGYAVIEADGAEEALRACAEHAGPIHLLLTDVVMPRTSGRELAEKIGVLRPGTKVLFMSGYTEDAVVRHGVLAAEQAFLQKPFSAAGLTRKVREVLG